MNEKRFHVAGLCNALMDTLIVADDEELASLEYGRGLMHLISHEAWEAVFQRYQRPDMEVSSGGSGANTIAGLGLLGARAVYRGQVGEDERGQVYARSLVDACGGHLLRFEPGLHTGKCLSLVSRQDQERTMLTDLGAAPLLSDLGPFAQAIRESTVYHTTGYALLSGPIRGAALEGVKVARAAGTRVSVDVADPFVVKTLHEDLWRLLKDDVDLVFMNEEEAKALCPGLEPQEAALHTGATVRTVVVKLGSKGSVVVHEGRKVRVGIHKVKAVDTTGAGDSYAAGFLYGYSRGWSPERCAALAARTSALTVSILGAVYRDRDDLREAVAAVEESP